MRGTIQLFIALGACIAVSWGLDFLLDTFIEKWVVDIIRMCGISIILAVSLNVINGMTGQFSIGHAGFMAIGAYVSTRFTTTFTYFNEAKMADVPVEALMPGPVGFVLSLLAGGVAASIAGFAVGIPTLRLRGDYLAIATLGFGEIVSILLQNTNSLGGAAGISGLPSYSNVFAIYSVALICIVLTFMLQRSTWGRSLIAIRENEIAAEVMGIRVARRKVMAFVYGAFFAGVAGALYAHHMLVVRPEQFNFMKSIEVVVMLVLGGLGSISGAIVGAIALTTLPEWLRDIEQEYQQPGLKMIVYSLILILMMIFRPQGIFGQRELSLRLFKSLLPGGKDKDKRGGA